MMAGSFFFVFDECISAVDLLMLHTIMLDIRSIGHQQSFDVIAHPLWKIS